MSILIQSKSFLRKSFFRTIFSGLVLGMLSISTWTTFSVLISCTSSKHALSKNQSSLNALRKQLIDLEEQYFQVLNRLDKYPDHRPLRLEKARLKKEISLVKMRIRTVQKQVDMLTKDWEKRLDEGRIQRNMQTPMEDAEDDKNE